MRMKVIILSADLSSSCEDVSWAMVQPATAR